MFSAKITIDYLAELILGPKHSFELTAFDPSILPLWIGRSASIAELATPEGVRFLLIFPEPPLTAERLIFISRLIKEKKKLPVILVADQLAPQVRSALTRARCQTVITGRQLFAPELGISLNTKIEDSLKTIETTPWKEQVSELSKTARQVLVSVLLKDNFQKEPMNLSTFATIFREMVAPTDDPEVALTVLSYLSRAFTQLEELQLITTTREGRERKIRFNSPTELWVGLCRFTKKTVSETALIPQSLIKKDRLHLYSGETALSYYSNLAAPSIPVYALPSRNFNELKRHRRLNLEVREDDESVKIEHWKTDPYFLWQKKYVNPIDLALSLRLEKDERVRFALTEVLKKYGLAAEQLWSY